MINLDASKISEIIIYNDNTVRVEYKTGALIFVDEKYLTEVFVFCLNNANKTEFDKETKDIKFVFED